MIQCPYCSNILLIDNYCESCNIDLVCKRPYNAIQDYCDENNIDFESYYGVFKELPSGYKTCEVKDLYKYTKTTSKIWTGKEILIHSFHTDYYEKYTIKADTNMKSLIPFFKHKRVFIKSN